jgi:ribosomal protein L37E
MSIRKLNTPFTHHWKCDYCGRGFFSDAPGIYELVHGGVSSGSAKLELYSVTIHITPRLPSDSPSAENTQLNKILCERCLHKAINVTPGIYTDNTRKELDDHG